MWNQISIQIVEMPILHSNPIFKHPDLVVHLDWVFMHMCICVSAFVPVHTCMRLPLCTYNLSIINSRKLIQFIAFTYWSESSTGRDYGWLGVYENRGRKGERWRRGRKENGNICVKKKHQCGRMRIGHILKQNHAHGWLHLYQRVKKSWIYKAEIGEVRIYRYWYEGLWYDVVCPQNGFSLLAEMIK